MSQEQAVQTVERKTVIAVGAKGLDLKSFEDMWRFAVAVSKTPFVPKGMEKPETIMVAVQMGLELGISPMQALQNIAVINGKPSIYGDLAKGLVMASGLCESFREWYEGKDDDRKAICEVKRAGMDPLRREFGIADAKRAKLWGKAGPWTEYWPRMLRWRAVSWAIRDAFPDVIKGIGIREEIEDYHVPEVGIVEQGMLQGPSADLPAFTPEDLTPAADQTVRPEKEAQSESPEAVPSRPVPDSAAEVASLSKEITGLRKEKGITPRDWLAVCKKPQGDMSAAELVGAYEWLIELPDKAEEEKTE